MESNTPQKSLAGTRLLTDQQLRDPTLVKRLHDMVLPAKVYAQKGRAGWPGHC